MSDLRKTGWHESIAPKAPTGPDGVSVPWRSYPCVRLLEAMDLGRARVLEFGSGASTQRWASRCRHILSVEHDRKWFDGLPQPPNGEIRFAPCVGDWLTIDTPSDYLDIRLGNAPWDIVVIDGMGRQTCAEHAASLMSSTGIVLLDDTYNPDSSGAQLALERAFPLRLDLWGMKLGIPAETCTRIFGVDFNQWFHSKPGKPKQHART